jgi:hypothetical protein
LLSLEESVNEKILSGERLEYRFFQTTNQKEKEEEIKQNKKGNIQLQFKRISILEDFKLKINDRRSSSHSILVERHFASQGTFRINKKMKAKKKKSTTTTTTTSKQEQQGQRQKQNNT